MAEILHGLRKKLQRKKATKSSGSKSTRKSSKAATNPYASRGLEKFATLLEDIQTKQQATKSLAERTASSLSAARCISRSAQEWTASTLVRTAERCSSPETTRAPRVDVPADELQRDVENLREERQAQGFEVKEVSSSNSAPSLGKPLTMRRCRSMTSKSAFVLLVTLSAFLCDRAGRVGKPLLAALTFSAVIRIWRRGKFSAWLMFSSVALYFLSPLRSYLVTRIPKQLVSVPQNPESSQNAANGVSQPELRAQVVGISVAAPALSPISECRSPNPVTLPHAKSPSRRLAKKISSGLKKLKIFRSSSSSVSVHTISESSSSPSSSSSSHTEVTAPSSHRRMCPFSRKTGAVVVVEAQASDATSSSSSHNGSRTSTHHGSRGKGRILQRQRSWENISSSNSMGLRGGRMLSSETLEQYNQAGQDSIASSACESKHSTSSVDHEAAPVAWPVVGLLVTLLFLVVGRVPAIVATSLFFVVVSPHSRGRERRESRSNYEAAARKLHHSPPPRVGRWAASPPPRWH